MVRYPPVAETAATDHQLVDQEFVVHIFAPANGPLAAKAYDQVCGVWAACRDRFGMTRRIVGTGLPRQPSGDPSASTSGVLAAQEHPDAHYQAILRREHDVLNLSVVFAPARDGTGHAHSRRLRIGSASPCAWIEFDREWDNIAAGGMGALLGVARLYQAKVVRDGHALRDASIGLADATRSLLPPLAQEARWWRECGLMADEDFTVWEFSPRTDAHTERRIVVLAPGDRGRQLDAWTWGCGDVGMPPLARYLMQAARIRHRLQLWTDGRRIEDFIGKDQALAGWCAQLDDDVNLDITQQRGPRLHEITTSVVHPAASLQILSGARQSPARVDGPWPMLQDNTNRFASTMVDLGRQPARITVRMGFSVDVVGYSRRSALAKLDAQERTTALVGDVLHDMNVDVVETDHHGTGDGMIVFLPAAVEIHRALPRLIWSTTARLGVDNQRYRDRLRLRMATVIGPFGRAAIGFSGNTVIECGRLVDSRVLRGAITDHPATDLAVLVSEQLHSYVIGEGHPGLDATEFRRVDVRAKEFRARAWLWVAPLGSDPVRTLRRGSAAPVAVRIRPPKP